MDLVMQFLSNPVPVLFYVFGGIAIACSLLVILKKSPIASAFSLVLVFFSFGAIYAMMDAHLVAVLQILVYAGAIMVLFLFVIMLLGSDKPSFDFGRSHVLGRLLGGLGAAGLLGLFVWAFRKTPAVQGAGQFTAERIAAAGGNTQVISELMFSEYILPFELTSVLLLGAIVGSVAIAKRKGKIGLKGAGK